MLRGSQGSKVSLTIIRGSMAEPHVVELTREKPAVPTVSGRIASPGIGYLRIPSFAPANLSSQITSKVNELSKAGATRLVVDVRRSAEGPYEAGIAAARLFVGSGKLASREARGVTLDTVSAQQGDGAIKLPVAILTNVGTGGAAEIFTAALVENGRAEAIGEKTIGRAATQKLIKLPDGSGLYMSAVRFNGPKGEPLHGKGVTPTVEVEEPEVEFGSKTPVPDPVLDKALERFGLAKAA
jgi:carboxyl-terminal processing protease